MRKITTPVKQSSIPDSASQSPARNRKLPLDLGNALIEAFKTNEEINQRLLQLLDPAIWRTPLPCSKRRTIATSFAHIHNVRLMRLRMSGQGAKLEKLDRANVTPLQAMEALANSSDAMVGLIRDSLDAAGHVYQLSA